MSTSKATPAGATARPAGGLRRGGAPLLLPAISYVVVALAGIIAPPLVAGVTPYSSDSALLDFYAEHTGAAHLLAFLVLASSVPFAVFGAIASHRVKEAGFDVPGRLIALVGATTAAVLLALSGMSTLALTQSGVSDEPAVVRALSGLSFATGGPGFVTFCGLLLAGISVPALLSRLTPRWVAVLGLAMAAVCLAASLAAGLPALNLLLPVGRFGTMIWILAIAGTLSSSPSRSPR